MGKKNFNLKYDPKTDILHIAFGKAKESVSVEQEPEVFVRLDPKSKEIVGLTVLGFKNSFLSKKQDITLIPSFS
ncbi:hypothetical protein A3D78_05685 [Candidatus Gottesmanbacteria bacterium RIFCSPHIGHO2_02_FULL_39_14]|uniref:DUF2283 domain-containing protein n=1 Tax=Candidatus Gottesmanbacteria bacterium RIFCSPHIGHO2_02_FULL_39_14 TaxID=1798383 RepID=A0A1F6A2N3_9BACT|nr:MAG: hypothetical protein A3D78_05685 [Candidatus Gottesmanbacteria bacterium RIFCSPHIGHO2_02_FULL_39_14]